MNDDEEDIQSDTSMKTSCSMRLQVTGRARSVSQKRTEKAKMYAYVSTLYNNHNQSNVLLLART